MLDSGAVAEPFEREWFMRHPMRVAHDLVGAMLVVDRNGDQVVARIVEVEAYGGMEDLASHATMYRVGRETIGSAPGVLYMQRSYGLHTMTNIVAHESGKYGAVLLRAAEDPVKGLELAKARRLPKQSALLVGPGSLSRGVGTMLTDTLQPLGAETGVLLAPGVADTQIWASPRIGITRATEALWRLFDGSSQFVSRHRRGEIIGEPDLDRLIAQLPELHFR
ncbi:MAG: DNA-3-methyladenine glycosylase [Chloroflexota bacterium]|nr:DNA-3-methyladenine glycosylase [Chloroflexota bacterium]